jgi:twinkle protein
VHIHIVHHIRKLESEEKIPGKYDIKGTGTLTDRVDNVMLVWRNKMKERIVREESAKLPSERRSKDGKPLLDEARDWSDAQIIVVKNRDGGEEATIRLWYWRDGNSFHPSVIKSRPFPFSVPRRPSGGFLIKDLNEVVEEEA